MRGDGTRGCSRQGRAGEERCGVRGAACCWWQGRGHGVCASPERPLHPKEKVLEQALQWCKLPEPSAAYLLVKKVPIGEGSCLFTGKAVTKGPSLKGCPQVGQLCLSFPLPWPPPCSHQGRIPETTVGP